MSKEPPAFATSHHPACSCAARLPSYPAHTKETCVWQPTNHLNLTGRKNQRKGQLHLSRRKRLVVGVLPLSLRHAPRHNAPNWTRRPRLARSRSKARHPPGNRRGKRRKKHCRANGGLRPRLPVRLTITCKITTAVITAPKRWSGIARRSDFCAPF